ncbi:hypothetical protein C1646_716323 [Rhizophagus diaphanus]|nr:hypothetical protein C1646_716323 [Rhizophagus diaphanus] [Rhizophagus sp. MUCL 43196]
MIMEFLVLFLVMQWNQSQLNNNVKDLDNDILLLHYHHDHRHHHHHHHRPKDSCHQLLIRNSHDFFLLSLIFLTILQYNQIFRYNKYIEDFLFYFQEVFRLFHNLRSIPLDILILHVYQFLLLLHMHQS